MSSENDISITKTQLKFSFKHCVVKVTEHSFAGWSAATRVTG